MQDARRAVGVVVRRAGTAAAVLSGDDVLPSRLMRHRTTGPPGTGTEQPVVDRLGEPA
jgi:hypothetical protein